MILFKWVERGLGLVSTLILVRILSPADFGVVAMAMSFIAMAEVLTAFAFDIALIHDQSAGIAHYNSAWTANVVLGLVIAATMCVAAYPMSLFYGEPALTVLVCVLAIGPFAAGLENIGVVAFRKDLEFHKEFTFQISRKIISFCVAIPLAFLLRSYWALVFGILASKIGGSLLSYWAHKFRPRISFQEISSLLRFSRWLLINNLVNFFKDRSTDFFLGRVQGPALLGIYNVTSEFANLPTYELGAPINRALLPGFSKLGDDVAGIKSSFSTAVGLLALLAVPIGAGLFVIAPYMVPVLLGEKWLSGVPVMQILSINSTILVFHGTIVTLFIAVGRPQSATKTNAVFVAVLFFGLIQWVDDYGSIGAASAMLLACVISTPIFLIQLRRYIGVGFTAFLSVTARPVVASVGMVFAVRAVMPIYALGTPVHEGIRVLVISVATGVVSFIAGLIFLWIISGRRPGAESLVAEKVALRYTALKSAINSKVG